MDIYLPPLHTGQATIWQAGLDHRFNVVRCGRRWGKTAMLCNIAATYATASFTRPGLEELFGGRVGVFTAEYRQYQEIFDKLVELLAPLIKSQSRSEKRILLTNGGKIDFWVTNDNKLAGRGREYEVVLIDEAAFTKAPEMLEEIWPKSIKPTLPVPRGHVWVFSTPDGIDENNFFYALCNNKKLGFFEHYAPTSSNPYVPAEELEQEEKNCEPRVFRQEFLAEFVDWSKDALFDINKWLVDGNPVAMPETCDLIFAIADTALKGGQENDGTGFVYFAYTYHYVEEPELRIIDWDLTQIQGALLPEYIPGVYENLNRLSRICKPRMGSGGVFMEDAAMGAILLQKAETEGWDMKAIDSVLTGKGKDERAVMASGYHYLGRCKITEEAFNKTVPFKQAEANHLWKQVAGFHLADKKAHVRADDLLDGYMYGLIIAFGNGAAL